MAGIGDYLSSYFYGSPTPAQQDVSNQYSDIYRRAGAPATVKMGGQNLPFNRWHTQLAATAGQGSQSQPQQSGMDKLIQVLLYSALKPNTSKPGTEQSTWFDTIKKLFDTQSQTGGGSSSVPTDSLPVATDQIPDQTGAGNNFNLADLLSGNGGDILGTQGSSSLADTASSAIPDASSGINWDDILAMGQ